MKTGFRPAPVASLRSRYAGDGRERRLGLVFMVVSAAAVVLDGATTHLGAALVLALFAALQFAAAGLGVQRPVLRRAAAGGVIVAVILAATVVPTLRWSAPNAARFGSEALWSLPGALVPVVAFVAAVRIFRRERDSRRLWRFLARLGAVFALWGIAQQAAFPTWHFGQRTAYVDSLTGFYVNRNAAAALLTLTLLAALVDLDRVAERAPLGRWLAVVAGEARLRSVDAATLIAAGVVLIQVIALVLTRSRAGTVCGLLAAAGFAAVRWADHETAAGRRPSWRRLLPWGLAAAVPLVALLERVLQRFDHEGLDDARWCVLPGMIETARAALPGGVGLGGFVTAFAPHRDPVCGLAGVWDSAHSAWIQGITTLGLVFPALVLFMVAVLAGPLVAARRTAARREAVATIAAVLALVAHSTVDFPLEIPANAVLLAAMVASTLALATAPRRPDDRSLRHHGAGASRCETRAPAITAAPCAEGSTRDHRRSRSPSKSGSRSSSRQEPR